MALGVELVHSAPPAITWHQYETAEATDLVLGPTRAETVSQPM